MASIDLAKRAYDHGWRLDPIVRSLLDTDFYKLLMLQLIWRQHRDVPVTFSVINRSTSVRLAEEVDEAELRAKKKRLRAFQTALDELRHASEAVATAGAALIAAGDVSRAEASKVFKLSTGERAAAFPTRPRSESSVADAVDEPPNPVDDPSDESDEQHTDLGQ